MQSSLETINDAQCAHHSCRKSNRTRLNSGFSPTSLLPTSIAHGCLSNLTLKRLHLEQLDSLPISSITRSQSPPQSFNHLHDLARNHLQIVKEFFSKVASAALNIPKTFGILWCNHPPMFHDAALGTKIIIETSDCNKMNEHNYRKQMLITTLSRPIVGTYPKFVTKLS